MRKKRMILILIAVFLTGALIALWPTFENIAFEAKLQAITSDWNKQYKYQNLPWYHIDGFGSYYLGADNGYDIFYYPYGGDHLVAATSLNEESGVPDEIVRFTTEIADCIFYPVEKGCLLAYKNGEFISLSELYDEGLISEDAIHAACDSFAQYVEIILHSDPIALNEKELIYYCNKYTNEPRLIEYLEDEYERMNELSLNSMSKTFQSKLALLEEYKGHNEKEGS